MSLAQRKRIQLILDSPLYEGVKSRADSHAISLSMAVRDLVKEALEWEATLEVYRSPELLENLKQGLAEEKAGKLITEKRKREFFAGRLLRKSISADCRLRSGSKFKDGLNLSAKIHFPAPLPCGTGREYVA